MTDASLALESSTASPPEEEVEREGSEESKAAEKLERPET